ncbi:MAG: hypothetical protein ACK5HA_18210, partial [Planctomycetaceae bacterium]
MLPKGEVERCRTLAVVQLERHQPMGRLVVAIAGVSVQCGLFNRPDGAQGVAVDGGPQGSQMPAWPGDVGVALGDEDRRPTRGGE